MKPWLLTRTTFSGYISDFVNALQSEAEQGFWVTFGTDSLKKTLIISCSLSSHPGGKPAGFAAACIFGNDLNFVCGMPYIFVNV